MPTTGPLDPVPQWVLFLATVVLVLISVEIGHRLGDRRRAKPEHEPEGPLNAMVAATLGLLAFLLAFTFSLAASRFDTRKDLVLEEANAIGTAWLRAGMLPEQGDEIRALLLRYVDVRLEGVRSGDLLDARQQSEQLQNQMWEHATLVARSHPSPIVALFASALNDVIDVHAKRLHAFTQNRIPWAIWAALYLVATCSFAAMGYHAGVVGKSRSWAVLAVAITFSAVLWLIADLDRPGEGLLHVSQQALIDARASMTPGALSATRP
jgi:hypothetical protein